MYPNELVSIGSMGYRAGVRTVEQQLRALLDEGAADGTLGPGAKLPTERALAEMLSAPRSTIRRALDDAVRERTRGGPFARLTNPIHIGIGTK